MKRVDVERLLSEADHLATSLRYREAAETLVVAADLAEELGDLVLAREIRTWARRHVVVDWARRRWPDADVILASVTPAGGQPGSERTRFWIVRNEGRRVALELVSVSRRGRVTVLEKVRE